MLGFKVRVRLRYRWADIRDGDIWGQISGGIVRGGCPTFTAAAVRSGDADGRVFSLLFAHVTAPVTDTSPTCHYGRRRLCADRPPYCCSPPGHRGLHRATTIGCKSNAGSSGPRTLTSALRVLPIAAAQVEHGVNLAVDQSVYSLRRSFLLILVVQVLQSVCGVCLCLHDNCRTKLFMIN